MPRLTPADLDTLTLSPGSHDEQEGAACLWEAHSVRRNLPWGDDTDDSVSPVIRLFTLRLNDTTAPDDAGEHGELARRVARMVILREV